MKNLVLIFVVFLVGLYLGACAPTYKEARQDIMVPVQRPVQQEKQRTPGSLFEEQGRFSLMFVDKKGRNVGDVVTVKIVETSSASNSTNTETGKKTEMSAGITGFLGMEKRYPTQRHPYFNPFGSITGGMDSSFQGSGTTERKNAILATVTATVVEVLPNENLKIMGSREIVVNNERQLITLTGVIREKDIADDNTILSTYIADARIYYTGSGDLSESQRKGWLGRLLEVVWPF